MLRQVLKYHERTKHQPQRYARALGYLDWATQPDPFRRFAGAPRLRLDEVEPGPAPTLAEALSCAATPRALSRATLSQLLYDSLALSAWKEFQGTRWSLRCNPSSGNLHPTEAYVIAGAIEGLSVAPAVYHYDVHDHALETRRELAPAVWQQLADGLPAAALFVGLTSIAWRESWKYGERAFRYCHHDVGHAIGAVALAAAVFGWETRLLESVTDSALAVLLGVATQDGPEAEHPDCLLLLTPRDAPCDMGALQRDRLPADLLEALRAEVPRGEPNTLSTDHHDWPIVDEVIEATRREVGMVDPAWAAIAQPCPGALPASPTPVRSLMRQRRSAVAMDGETALPRATFLSMMASVWPSLVPFRGLPWRPRIHLALFVHRVDGLDPGLYLLLRDAAQRDVLASQLRQDLVWGEVDGVPEHLGLFLLVPLDARDAARTVSCGQDIAADGAFALGMLAEFEPSLQEQGACFYRRLHWEAGALGQVLYLAAEAAGVAATGIGCFFDDTMHRVLGLAGPQFQTLYHFTVGGAESDGRLRTLAAYAHRGPPVAGNP